MVLDRGGQDITLHWTMAQHILLQYYLGVVQERKKN